MDKERKQEQRKSKNNAQSTTTTAVPAISASSCADDAICCTTVFDMISLFLSPLSFSLSSFLFLSAVSFSSVGLSFLVYYQDTNLSRAVTLYVAYDEKFRILVVVHRRLRLTFVKHQLAR